MIEIIISHIAYYRQNPTNTLDLNPITHGQLKTSFACLKPKLCTCLVKCLSIEPIFSHTYVTQQNLYLNRMDAQHTVLLEHSVYRYIDQNLPTKE